MPTARITHKWIYSSNLFDRLSLQLGISYIMFGWINGCFLRLVKYFTGKGTELQDSLDLITSTISFHHWSDQPQGVREAVRVLRRGGLFILADMSLAVQGHPISRSQVRAIFIEAGLSIRSQTSPVPFYTFTVGEKT